MFDTTVELVGASVGPIDVDPGKEGMLELVFVSGITFPIAGPDGNPLRVPSGQYRFQLSRSQVIEFCQKAIDAAEELPEGSNIVIPTSNDEVEKIAKTIDKVTNNG